jgi:hypothetical protein
MRYFSTLKLSGWLIGISLTIILILSLILGFTGLRSGSNLVSEDAHWNVRGNFVRAEVPLGSDQFQSFIGSPEVIDFWRSTPNSSQSESRLVSPVFKAPFMLSLYIGGYPQHTDNQLLLLRVSDREQYILPIKQTGERWRQYKWLPPPTWWGDKVRLVAIQSTNNPESWIGISSPIGYSPILITGSNSYLALLPLYSLHILLFLLPGFILINWLQHRYPLPTAYILIFSIALTSLIGYLAFWCYWLNPFVGRLFSLIVLSGSILGGIYLLHAHKRRLRTLIQQQDFLYPLLLMVGVGLLYLCLLFMVEPIASPDIWIMERFLRGMPPDTLLPKLFADRLSAGEDLRQPILGNDWLTSDRPPLQTGIVLLQYPLMVWRTLSYQILGTIAQCSWIPAVWSVCRALRLSNRQMAIIYAFTIFSGFFLFNSLFLWPKLLAASLILFAFVVLLRPCLAQRPTSISETTLASSLVALSFLSHGGAIFTVPALFPLAIRPQNFPKLWRMIVAGCLAFLLLVGPWVAYQRLYNPPGNRLIKWHLAGVIDIDERSTGETIVEEYQRIGFRGVLEYKWQNMRTMVSAPALFNDEQNRRNNFLWTLNSLGVLNLSWIILPILFITNRPGNKLWLQPVLISLGVALTSVLVWMLLIFGPGTTSIHTGSYGTMTLLFVGLASVLSLLPNALVLGLLIFQMVYFFVPWIVTTPFRFPEEVISFQHNSLLEVAMVLCLASVTIVLIRLAYSSNGADMGVRKVVNIQL